MVRAKIKRINDSKHLDFQYQAERSLDSILTSMFQNTQSDEAKATYAKANELYAQHRQTRTAQCASGLRRANKQLTNKNERLTEYVSELEGTLEFERMKAALDLKNAQNKNEQNKATPNGPSIEM
jgi:hypothetical protein